MQFTIYITVKKRGRKLTFDKHENHPPGNWDEIGTFYRADTDTWFSILGRGIYASEVDADKLSDGVADVIGMGRRLT